MRILGLGTTQMPSAQGPKNKLYLNNFLLVQYATVLFYLGFLHSERWQCKVAVLCTPLLVGSPWEPG